MMNNEPQHIIEFSDKIRAAAPELEVILIEADIENPPTDENLWNEIRSEASRISELFPMDRIRHRAAIDATRAAYKALGKDPNRYRPSAEALCRRAVKGMDLYRTLAVIDLVNLISLRSGHSIGAFDADAIVGQTLTLGAGEAAEPYEAIGRGPLNIEGLPVYRDEVGGIGTPTSDNERTKLSEKTTHLLMTVNLYGKSEMTVDELETEIIRLLVKYASASDIRVKHYKI